jgi:hypothetical protein
MAKLNEQVFLTMVRGLRNTCAAAIDMMDLILDVAEREQQGDASASTGCPHPIAARVPKQAMGHPKRFYCTACEQDVEG